MVVPRVMISSIAAQGTQITQAKQHSDMQIAVLKKAQDQMKASGKAALTLIDAAAKPSEAPPTGDHTGKVVNVRA